MCEFPSMRLEQLSLIRIIKSLTIAVCHVDALAGMLYDSRACYAPREHAMRIAGMLCASRACHAPRGHAVRLAGMLCA